MLSSCVILNSCVWRQHFAISMVDVKIYVVHTIFIKTNSVRHIKPFLYTDFGYRLLCLPDLEYWLTASVTCQPGIRILPRSILSHPWYMHGFVFVMQTYLYCGLFFYFGLRHWLRFVTFAFSVYYGYADECIYCTSAILYQTICISLYSRNNDLCCDTTVEYM